MKIVTRLVLVPDQNDIRTIFNNEGKKELFSLSAIIQGPKRATRHQAAALEPSFFLHLKDLFPKLTLLLKPDLLLHLY